VLKASDHTLFSLTTVAVFMPPRIEKVDVLDGGFNARLSSPEFEEHIQFAHTYVEERVGSKGLEEATLTLLEKYLARHSIAATIEPPTTDAHPDFMGTYSFSDLRSTPHGQQAIELDPTDTLGHKQFDDFHSIYG
jgi:hypothetical protein